MRMEQDVGARNSPKLCSLCLYDSAHERIVDGNDQDGTAMIWYVGLQGLNKIHFNLWNVQSHSCHST